MAGDFNRDGNLDLAVLMEDTGEVWIYTGNGNGTFRHTFSIPVGDEATGLSVVPGNGPGLFNLLVGNGFGDVLILEGKGDGTFQIQGSRVSLSVVPNLLGPGQAGRAGRRPAEQPRHGPGAVGQRQTSTRRCRRSAAASSSEQLAPGDVQWAFLDKGATLPDADRREHGQQRRGGLSHDCRSRTACPPSPRRRETYFVGTAPASVTVADINGDGIPDMLIANQGSNDVSVIFGSYNASGDWVGIPGPRLKSGGDGPIAVIVQRSERQRLSRSRGRQRRQRHRHPAARRRRQGFFDDQDPQTLFNLGSAVVQPPTFVGTQRRGLRRDGRRRPGAVRPGRPGGRRQRGLLRPAGAWPRRPLPSGQVVVALADGGVRSLGPQGNGLSVASQLQAQGQTPACPVRSTW